MCVSVLVFLALSIINLIISAIIIIIIVHIYMCVFSIIVIIYIIMIIIGTSSVRRLSRLMRAHSLQIDTLTLVETPFLSKRAAWQLQPSSSAKMHTKLHKSPMSFCIIITVFFAGAPRLGAQREIDYLEAFGVGGGLEEETLDIHSLRTTTLNNGASNPMDDIRSPIFQPGSGARSYRTSETYFNTVRIGDFLSSALANFFDFDFVGFNNYDCYDAGIYTTFTSMTLFFVRTDDNPENDNFLTL